MPRQSKTADARAADARTAVTAIYPLLAHAEDCLRQHGAQDARTLAAWEAVEQHGATIHRQARLLAGKSRGG